MDLNITSAGGRLAAVGACGQGDRVRDRSDYPFRPFSLPAREDDPVIF
jgi:hypothetical protein